MRNPWRIPEGFRIYVESDQVGRIRTPEDQKAFKRLLAEKGVIGGDPNKDKDATESLSQIKRERKRYSHDSFTRKLA